MKTYMFCHIFGHVDRIAAEQEHATPFCVRKSGKEFLRPCLATPHLVLHFQIGRGVTCIYQCGFFLEHVLSSRADVLHAGPSETRGKPEELQEDDDPFGRVPVKGGWA